MPRCSTAPGWRPGSIRPVPLFSPSLRIPRSLSGNRPAESLFSGATTLRDLLQSEEAALLAAALSGKNSGGEPVSLDLALKKQTGVLRRYHLSLFFPPPAGPAGCIAGDRRGSCRLETHKRRSCLAPLHHPGGRGNAYRRGTPPRGSQRDPGTAGALPGGYCFSRCNKGRVLGPAGPGCGTPGACIHRRTLSEIPCNRSHRKGRPGIFRTCCASGGKEITGAIAVPILEGEEAVGTILLLTDDEVPAADIGNYRDRGRRSSKRPENAAP